MNRRMEYSKIISMLILGVISIGLSTIVFKGSKNSLQHITEQPPVSHVVPPQMQGKQAAYNPDLYIISSYTTDVKDNGIASLVQVPKGLDKGLAQQYPFPQPPQAKSVRH